MSESNENFLEIAGVIIAEGQDKDYLDGPIAVIPELAEIEKELFMMIARSVKDFLAENHKTELSAEEIQSMFIFVYAKAAEIVCNWHQGRNIEISLEGLFSGKIPVAVEENILEELKEHPLADDMFAAFADWNIKKTAQTEVHPLLPLLEALKWTYRTASSFVLDLLGYSQADLA